MNDQLNQLTRTAGNHAKRIGTRSLRHATESAIRAAAMGPDGHRPQLGEDMTVGEGVGHAVRIGHRLLSDERSQVGQDALVGAREGAMHAASRAIVEQFGAGAQPPQPQEPLSPGERKH